MWINNNQCYYRELLSHVKDVHIINYNVKECNLQMDKLITNIIASREYYFKSPTCAIACLPGGPPAITPEELPMRATINTTENALSAAMSDDGTHVGVGPLHE